MLATCVAVAACVHAVVPGLSWEAAFVLGAIVSPTDPVAATAIAGRLGVPRRVVTVVEGESLINDATAITAYRVALAAITAGTFSLGDAGGEFVKGAVGGVAIGLAVGWVIAQIRAAHRRPARGDHDLALHRLRGLPAGGGAAALRRDRRRHRRALHGLADRPRVTNAQVRMQSVPVWTILTFLLNSFLFVLIGLQLPLLLDELRDADYDVVDRVGYGALASLTVIVVRIVWVFTFAQFVPLRAGRAAAARHGADRVDGHARRRLARRRARDPAADRRGRADPRAPADPLHHVLRDPRHARAPGPQPAARDPRGSRVEPDDGEELEENKARKLAARAALDRLDVLAEEEWAREQTIERMRGMYRYRYDRFAARFDEEADGDAIEARTSDYLRLVAGVLEAQREVLEQLRRDGVISDDVMRRVEHELDLEEGRFLGA